MPLLQATRRSCALVLVLLAAVAAAGCGGSGSGSGGEGGKLEVVSFYPEGAPDYENLVSIDKGFAEEHDGAKVELVFGGGQNAPNIQARWRAGNPPEVNVGFFGPTAEAQAYAREGQVRDLTDAMDEDLPGTDGSWRDAILPSVLPWVSMDDRIYAIPRELTVVNFFYNKRLFEQNGLEPPRTWPQFLEVCRKLKAAGVAPLAVTGTFPGYMQFYLDYLLLRHVGAEPVEQAIAGKRSFASLPGVHEAAADLEQLVRSGAFMDGFQGTDFTAAQLAFFQGKAAMILMGSWLVGEMKASIPDDFELGTFPFPSVPGGAGDQDGIFGGVNVMVVAEQSKNPDLGVDWLRYFSRPEVQEKRVEQLDTISGFAGVQPPEYERDAAKKLAAGASFEPSYFNLFSLGKAKLDAYQQPITRLFFGKSDADQLVASIDRGLASAS